MHLRVVSAVMLADPAGNVEVLVLAQLLVVELMLVVPVQVVACKGRYLIVAAAHTFIYIAVGEAFAGCLLLLLRALLVDDLWWLNHLRFRLLLWLHLGQI